MGKRGGSGSSRGGNRKRGGRGHDRTVRSRMQTSDERPDSAIDEISNELEDLDVSGDEEKQAEIGVPLAMWVCESCSYTGTY